MRRRPAATSSARRAVARSGSPAGCGLGVGRRRRRRRRFDRRLGVRVGGVSGGRKLFGARSSTDSQSTGGASGRSRAEVDQGRVEALRRSRSVGVGVAGVGEDQVVAVAGEVGVGARPGRAAGWARRRRPGRRRGSSPRCPRSPAELVSGRRSRSAARPPPPTRPAPCGAMSIATAEPKLAQLALSRSAPPSSESPSQTALEMKRSSPGPASSWSAPPLLGTASSPPGGVDRVVPGPVDERVFGLAAGERVAAFAAEQRRRRSSREAGGGEGVVAGEAGEEDRVGSFRHRAGDRPAAGAAQPPAVPASNCPRCRPPG